MSRNDTATACLPASPFQAVGVLFLHPAESRVREVLERVHELVVLSPRLLGLVESDLDAHALAKKARRVADARWRERRARSLPGLACDPVEVDPQELVLLDGRPRTPAFVVILALVLRGYLGAGFKDRDTESLLAESVTLRTVIANLGIRMPRASTLTELVNAVSVDTREQVLTAQLEGVLAEGLDDFTTLLADSTHVSGNTAWPTDSGLMVALVERALRVGESLPQLGLPALQAQRALHHATKMRTLDREIGLAKGKRDQGRARRRRYEKLLRSARKAHALLGVAIIQCQRALKALDAAPSRTEMARRAVEQLSGDLCLLAKVIDNCEARIVRGEKVPMADKIISVSDDNAAYIAKGQREAIIGYKPQIARSAHGYVTAVRVPQGNAADSAELLGLVNQATERTGINLRVLSVDDGYASAANHAALRKRGIDIVSINGAKGRKLTSDADWDSPDYANARNQRSAVESLIYTLKHSFDFDEVARRGIDPVRAELLEKAIAHNFCNTIRIRNRRNKQLALAA